MIEKKERKKIMTLVGLLIAVIIKASIFETILILQQEWLNFIYAFALETGLLVLITCIWYWIYAEEEK